MKFLFLPNPAVVIKSFSSEMFFLFIHLKSSSSDSLSRISARSVIVRHPHKLFSRNSQVTCCSSGWIFWPSQNVSIACMCLIYEMACQGIVAAVFGWLLHVAAVAVLIWVQLSAVFDGI
uniref:Ovule protein n=1 Tax=Angiostrongylus cantonensis TaxID=6313 RepID=A0A0K0CUD9_ANGCA